MRVFGAVMDDHCMLDIILNGCTILHIYSVITKTGIYRDNVLDLYVELFKDAICNNLFLMDNYAFLHRDVCTSGWNVFFGYISDVTCVGINGVKICIVIVPPYYCVTMNLHFSHKYSLWHIGTQEECNTQHEKLPYSLIVPMRKN